MRINKLEDEMLLECEKRMNFDTSKLNILIKDNGELHDLNEIIQELKKLEHCSSTKAMSDHQLFLQGKKEMLQDVISYLEKISIK